MRHQLGQRLRFPLVLTALLAIVLLAIAGCSPSDESGATGGDKFPDVRQVDVTAESGGTYSFAVTMTSPYDSPERDADGWRIVDADGTVYATFTLGHDHADEQPFTRDQTGVEIPSGVTEVKVEGHDTENGYGGGTSTAAIPGS